MVHIFEQPVKREHQKDADDAAEQFGENCEAEHRLVREDVGRCGGSIAADDQHGRDVDQTERAGENI